jgi:similar to stage IV sporulation protein
MLLNRLWNFIKGYVIILVEGYFLERFINICAKRKIFLWDVKNPNDLSMTLKVSIKGFKMLRPIARKSKCKVRIIKKKGLPFIINRYKKRKMFLLGTIIFVLLVNLLASFIWDIEILGNKETRSKDILQELSRLGVKPGVLKYNIDVNNIARTLVLQIDELGWASFEIKGTKAKVYVEERIKPPTLIPKDVPCNIIAKKDGLIDSIVVKNGEKVAEEGDTVVKGQLLVSGVIKNEQALGQTKLVHALGEIKARTWYEGNSTINIKTIEAVRTGCEKNVYFFIFLKDIFSLNINKNIVFKNYDKIESRKILKIGDNFLLPFGVIIETYYENEIIDKELSLDEAKSLAKENVLKKVIKAIPKDAEIINTYTDFIEGENGLIIANAIFECIEDIGTTEEIGGK